MHFHMHVRGRHRQLAGCVFSDGQGSGVCYIKNLTGACVWAHGLWAHVVSC
jgi:hypothetical protein